MPLDEYLYADDRRLDAYVEHLGSPLAFDKVPVWSAKLSLKGPEASGVQERHPRPLTRPEKVERLLKHLREEKLLAEGRFEGREVFADGARVFHLESCQAIKFFIPPIQPEDLLPYDPGLIDELMSSSSLKLNPIQQQQMRDRLTREDRQHRLTRAREQLTGFEGLNVWFSDRHHSGSANPSHGGQLFLVVGFPKDDEAHFSAWSAYSALAGLFNELQAELGNSVFRPHSHQVKRNSPSVFQDHFLADPLGAFQTAGARFSSWRAIKVLYRVRDAVLFRDPSENREEVATIGYPIFITAQAF
jgi:hypothetical protein